MPDLTGKAALVTGAGSGIGRATALRLARDGAAVLCADLNGDAARETASAIGELGCKAGAATLDVRDEAQVRRVLQQALDELGGLQILVNNAGIGGAGGTDWTQTMSVNVEGVYFGLYHGAALMAQRGGGAIVNTSSVAGLVSLGGPLGDAPLPESAIEAGMGAYVASKHAVVGLTQQYAVIYAQRGVRVNAVAPGYIYSAMTERAFSNPEVVRMAATVHPLGRIGTADEVAAAIAFLASDDASFITGAVLPVDGGYLAR